MNLTTVLFYFFIVVAGSAALYMVITKDLLHAALGLLLCLLSVAALFIFMGAEFLAITQILVYAGGVVVLIIFGVMLTQRIKGNSLVILQNYTVAGILVAAGFLFVFIKLFSGKAIAERTAETATVQQIGVTLLTEYALPIEISGILLLVCLIASAFAATAHQRK